MTSALLTLALAQQNNDIPPEAAAAIGIIFILAALVGLAVGIFIIFLLYKAAQAIPQQHQQLSPGMVWLLLIPLFNIVWQFFVILKISGGYKSYFDSINRTDVGDCGKTIGLVAIICSLVSFIPLLGFLTGIASLVCMIIYLVKVSGYKNQVTAPVPA